MNRVPAVNLEHDNLRALSSFGFHALALSASRKQTGPVAVYSLFNPRAEVDRVLVITEREVGDITVLGLAGRLVLFEGDAMLRHHVDDLVRRGRVKILLDLGAVTYIDSAGIGMMIAKYLSVRRKGGDLKLMHLTARGLLVMTITKLLTIFESFDSEEQALRSFTA